MDATSGNEGLVPATAVGLSVKCLLTSMARLPGPPSGVE